MASTMQDVKDPNKRAELDERAKRGEEVIPRGFGRKSVEAQLHLAEGRNKGGLGTKDKSGDERARVRMAFGCIHLRRRRKNEGHR